MPIGTLLLFGAIFIAGGLYNLYGLDSLWQSQEYHNETQGIANSVRTSAWEERRVTIAWLGMVMGGIFLALAFFGIIGAGSSTRERPIGSYSCLNDDKITAGEFVVYIEADGKGNAQSVPFTWTYDGTSRVTFAGDSNIVAGQFTSTEPFNFKVVDREGGVHSCVTRR